MESSRREFLRTGLATATVIAFAGNSGCSDDKDGNGERGGSAGSASGGSSGTSASGGSSGTSATGGSSGTSATGGSSGTSASGGSSGTSATGGSSGTSATGGSSGTSATGGSSGASGTGPDAGATGGTGGTGGSTCDTPQTIIGRNHGHEMVVSLADITAGIEKTYMIRGIADHGHAVTLTSEHFTALRTGATLNLTSTTDSVHDHMIIVSCG